MIPAAIMVAAVPYSPAPTLAQAATTISAGQGRRVTKEARGNFDITTKPEGSFGDGVGRFSLEKAFHGDIGGTSIGEMLAVRTKTPGSAGYVLIEQVSAKVNGKAGGFMLQHYGIMDRNTPQG
jgi:hypothetical protein